MAGFLDAGGGGGGGSPPEADGPDDPERGSTPPGQEVVGEPGPDPDPADDETDGSALDSIERTLDQLRGGGGPAVDRDSVRLDSSDIPVAPGQWPLGFPLQGLPRAAVTFNLNYVYDEQKDQWVRDTGNGDSSGGGGGVQIVAEGTETVSPDKDSVVFTGVLGFDRLVRATASLASLSNIGRPTDISEGAFGQFRNDIVYVQEYDPVFNEWLIRIANEVGRPIDVRWALLEFSPG